MPEEKALEQLLRGSDAWNAWRRIPGVFRPDLTASMLRSLNLEGINLSKCDLSRAIFIEAQLAGATFEDSRLNSANLSDCSAVGANFARSDMQSARLRRAVLSESDFSHSDLNGADFSNSKILDCQFEAANLTSTNFSGADLSGSNFARADLRQVVFVRADIRGADLRSAANLTLIQLEAAFGDSDTLLPEGLGRPPTWPEVGTRQSSEKKGVPALVTPVPLGWHQSKISVRTPTHAKSKISNSARGQLLNALRELSDAFAGHVISSGNIDRRIADYARKYSDECNKPHEQAQPILLDSYLRVISYLLQRDEEGLPAWLVAEFEVWQESHRVLEQAYRVLAEFKKAVRLANIPSTGIPTSELKRIEKLLDEPAGIAIIASSVRATTTDLLTEPSTNISPKAAERFYSIGALAGRIWQLLKRTPGAVKASAELAKSVETLKTALAPFLAWVKGHWKAIVDWFN